MTTIDDLVRDLVDAEPELDSVLQEHLGDNDELLPHLLLGDVTRWLEKSGPNAAVLAVLEHHMAAGDDAVQNVVAASFLENLVAGEPADDAIRAALGPRLRAELDAMESWTPDDPEAAT